VSWDLKPVYLTRRTFLIFNQTYEFFLRGSDYATVGAQLIKL
jgi:hypothetical protein